MFLDQEKELVPKPKFKYTKKNNFKKYFTERQLFRHYEENEINKMQGYHLMYIFARNHQEMSPRNMEINKFLAGKKVRSQRLIAPIFLSLGML